MSGLYANPAGTLDVLIGGQTVGKFGSQGLEQAGTVVQVVTGLTTTQVSNITNTLADTTLTATITPKYANSKILVLINHQDCRKSAANVNNYIGIKLFRGATDLGWIAANTGGTATAMILMFNVSGTLYDSPATTSATTYKTQFANTGINTDGVSVQYGGTAPSTITLMEIKQ